MRNRSEAIKGANPIAINSPQKPPFGLSTERISGTSFTAPRAENQQTWLYRTVSSYEHGDYQPINLPDSNASQEKMHITPNGLIWPNFDMPSGADFISGQRILASNGDPSTKSGLAYLVFCATRDMQERTAYASSDGDVLIVPHSGALDIQTELGHLLVRQNEFCVLPRGIRYRITLPQGRPARGFIIELYQGHFQLPELGPIGSTGLANARDFQIPTASFDGHVVNGIAKATRESEEWTIINKFSNSLFSCTQAHTPFDVVSWHGTYYPYKYDLARFCVLGSVLFDHPDPSLFTVLTAPSHRAPGHSICDFAVIPPRWAAMEGTYWAPYYHRNCMSEFAFPVIREQSVEHPLNQGSAFRPFGALLNNSMVAHGMDRARHEEARERDTSKPVKVDDGPFFLCLVESEYAMGVSEFGIKNVGKEIATVPKL